jgi:hypothetical protein
VKGLATRLETDWRHQGYVDRLESYDPISWGMAQDGQGSGGWELGEEMRLE